MIAAIRVFLFVYSMGRHEIKRDDVNCADSRNNSRTHQHIHTILQAKKLKPVVTQLLLSCCKLLSQILVMRSGKCKLFFVRLLDEINSGVHLGLLSLRGVGGSRQAPCLTARILLHFIMP